MKMACWLVAAVCLAGLALGGCVTPDRERIQGTWAGHEIGKEGSQYTVIISDNNMEFRSADNREWYKGTITLDETSEPRTMDLLIKECVVPRYIGKTAKGIYEIAKNTLTFAGNEPGIDSRPATLAPADGSRAFVLTKKQTQQ